MLGGVLHAPIGCVLVPVMVQDSLPHPRLSTANPGHSPCLTPPEKTTSQARQSSFFSLTFSGKWHNTWLSFNAASHGNSLFAVDCHMTDDDGKT